MKVEDINIMVRKNQTEYIIYSRSYMDNIRSNADVYTEYRNKCNTLDISDPYSTHIFIHVNLNNILKVENNMITFKDFMIWNLGEDDYFNSFLYKYRQAKIKQLIE